MGKNKKDEKKKTNTPDDKDQNQGHNAKKEALGPNTKR